MALDKQEWASFFLHGNQGASINTDLVKGRLCLSPKKGWL